MAVRRFDGVDDAIELAGGAVVAGAMTVALIVRPVTLPSPSNDRTLYAESDAVGTGPSIDVIIAANGTIWSDWGAGDTGWNPGLTAGVWYLLVVSKASGSQRPRLDVYDFAARTWRMRAVASGSVSEASGTPATIRFGGLPGWAYSHMDCAAGARWNAVLNATQATSLTAGTIADWLRVGTPAALWTFDQESTSQPVLDLTGNGADQRAIDGTSVLAEEPPLAYRASGAAATIAVHDGSAWADRPLQIYDGSAWRQAAGIEVL